MDIRVGACASNIANIAPVLTTTDSSLGAMAQTKFAGSTDFFRQLSGFPKREDGVIPLKEEAAIEVAFKELTPFNVALARGLDPTASRAALAIEDVHLVSTLGTRDAAKAIAVTDGTPADWAVIDEEWIVVFTAAAAGEIFGKRTGYVHAFAALNAAMAPVDGNSKKYFSIPASFFTGTWADGDSYVFYTMAGGASAYASAHSGNIGFGAMAAPVDIRVEAVYTFPNGTNTLTFVLPRAQAEASTEIDFQDEEEAKPPIRLAAKDASSANAAGHAVWDAMPLGRMIWA
jgi:hypothetical protein